VSDTPKEAPAFDSARAQNVINAWQSMIDNDPIEQQTQLMLKLSPEDRAAIPTLTDDEIGLLQRTLQEQVPAPERGDTSGGDEAPLPESSFPEVELPYKSGGPPPPSRGKYSPEPEMDDDDPRKAEHEREIARMESEGLVYEPKPFTPAPVPDPRPFSSAVGYQRYFEKQPEPDKDYTRYFREEKVLRRPSQSDAFDTGLGQGFFLGFGDELADKTEEVVGGEQRGGAEDLAASVEHQPEAELLGELFGSFLLGGPLGEAFNLARLGMAARTPTLATSTAAGGALSAGAGMAEDAITRAGKAEGGLDERLDAAKGAVPFMGDEEDPFPLGFALGGPMGMTSGASGHAQRSLRNDQELGPLVRNLEEGGGELDLLHVAKPRPDVDTAPTEVPQTPSKLGSYVPDAAKPQRKYYQDASTGSSNQIAERYKLEAAESEQAVYAGMAAETAEALKNEATQRKVPPMNLARTLVRNLSERTDSPFAESSTGQEALRRMVARVEPGEPHGSLREIPAPELDESAAIEVTRAQLHDMGLEDLIPKKPVSMRPAPSSRGVDEQTQGVLGEPLSPKGIDPLGSPYWSEREATPKSGRPAAQTQTDAHDVQKYRLVIAPKDARELDVITDDIDAKVNWSQRNSSESFEQYAAAVRQDRTAYGEDWANTKQKHSDALAELEEARTGVGLSPKETFDKNSRVQTNKIARAIAGFRGEPAQQAALRLARSPETRKVFTDNAARADVRDLKKGAPPRVTPSGLPTLGTVDEWRLRLDPTMGALAKGAGTNAAQATPLALSLRDIADADFEGGIKDVIRAQLASYAAEQDKKKRAEQEARINEQAEAVRRGMPAAIEQEEPIY
jgi:hypothetical protein